MTEHFFGKEIVMYAKLIERIIDVNNKLKSNDSKN